MSQAPADDDWRLQGQERHLAGASFKLIPWTSLNPGWDHDHCEFCSVKLTGSNIADALHEGYATQDLVHWVCPQCFHDFRARLHFKVLP